MADPQPQLLCFHPGGFIHGTPDWEAAAAAYGRSLGFATVGAGDYPLDSLANQRAWVLTVAAIVAQAGPVYAYGDSAGGTLAAFLATRARVAAAATYGAVPDVWAFLQQPYAGDNWQALGYPDEADCDLTSPVKHAAQVPVHAYRGETDAISGEAVYAAWDADPNVTWIPVAGSHLSGGPPDPTYTANMQRAINWLAWRAGLL